MCRAEECSDCSHKLEEGYSHLSVLVNQYQDTTKCGINPNIKIRNRGAYNIFCDIEVRRQVQICLMLAV